MAKQLAYDVEARTALKRGVDKVADAVRITIGPKGRNVVLDKKFGSPTITNDGLRNVAAGANPMLLKIGIQKAVDEAVKAIKEQSVQISEREKIAQVASISAADPAIGETVADAMEKVGKDGVITVEESKGITTELELVEGMQFDKGYVSAYMVTNPTRMEAVL